MTTAAMRDTIALAKLHEQEFGKLNELFELFTTQNAHMVIQLPEEGAAQCLVDFIQSYIEYVPDFIDATRNASKAASIEKYTEPFLKLAEDYFLKPSDISSSHAGLHALMDQAYLAHRLLEEVNDRHMARTSIPLIPMDNTLSNLIVHNLIGEPFANELDEAIHYEASRARINEGVYESEAFKTYVEQYKKYHSLQVAQHWPCLNEQLAISLQLGSLSL